MRDATLFDLLIAVVLTGLLIFSYFLGKTVGRNERYKR